ncbi:hypothetical protein [Rickettsia endosymbiont of Orchestes rusci]|uniref:hypothetical protein n=1 Tax=Rickettsia endosymbiont of Orchestes rusci TaxID=3066250 RepID=UPI00313BFE71
MVTVYILTILTQKTRHYEEALLRGWLKAPLMSFPRSIVAWFQIPRHCEEGRSPDVAIQAIPNVMRDLIRMPHRLQRRPCCMARIFGVIPAQAGIRLFFVMLNLFQHLYHLILK